MRAGFSPRVQLEKGEPPRIMQTRVSATAVISLFAGDFPRTYLLLLSTKAVQKRNEGKKSFPRSAADLVMGTPASPTRDFFNGAAHM